MERITRKELEAMVDRINSLTGSPMEYHTTGIKTSVGHYFISGSAGSLKLARTTSERGARADISGSYGTKRAIFNFMNGLIYGLETHRK